MRINTLLRMSAYTESKRRGKLEKEVCLPLLFKDIGGSMKGRQVEPLNVLLEQTFTSKPKEEHEIKDSVLAPTPNVLALARVYQAIAVGSLTVNGLAPDAAYSVSEYLMHGGRVRFDLTALSGGERAEFFQYVFNQNQIEEKQATIYPRKFATHRPGGVDADGHLAEKKSGILGFLLDFSADGSL